MYAPPITVFMPLYNSRTYVGEAIESILHQSFRDFEFLIIDDSDDGSTKIVDAYARKDERIRHIKEEGHLDLRVKLNQGIQESRGKYIVRMEADDLSRADRIERQYAFMEAHPEVDISSCFKTLFGEHKGVWKYPLDDERIRCGLIWQITIPQGPSIMKRDFLLDGGHFYKEGGPPYAEDWEFFYHTSHHGHFRNLPEGFYYYRRGHESISKQMLQKKNRIRLNMYRLILSDLGVPFSEEELYVHRFIKGDPEAKVGPDLIRRAREWLDKLIAFNEEQGIYDSQVFAEVCEEKWDRLFYRLPLWGDQVVRSYWKCTPSFKKAHLYYFLKHKLNRTLGRKAAD